MMETPAHVSGKAAKLQEMKFQPRKKEGALMDDDLGWGDEENFKPEQPAAFSLNGPKMNGPI